MFIDFFWCSLHQRGKVLPDFTTMPTPFFQSAGAGRFQEIPKLLSGQEKLAADVAVVEWIIETARPLTVSQHKKFRKMMEACSAGRYHGPCYQTVLGLTMQLSENGKDAASTFLNRLMTDGTKSVRRLPVLL